VKNPILTVALAATVALAGSVWGQVIDHKETPASTRSELHDSQTPLPELDEPSADPEMLTPLPIEMADDAAHLPEGFALAVPFEGRFQIRQGYGYQARGWTHHTIGNERSANDFFALDFAMPTGIPIFAVAPGRVITSNRRTDSYGNYVVIDHGDGITSITAHLSTREFDVMEASPEVWVEAGQLIGLSGESGTSYPHLHLAVHTGAERSHSGADVGGLATVPEPMGGLYGLREGHWIGEE